MRKSVICIGSIILVMLAVGIVYSAYHHEGEDDTPNFLSLYPEKAGTKLDHCALCHTGGSYVNSKGKTVSLGSCQWCHDSYGYDASGNILDTLNPYGLAYRNHGSNQDALSSIAGEDSDGDGYTNGVEIAATRFPGDPDDDPTKVTAPSRVYTREQLEAMPVQTQFMLLNTSRSGDFYAEYTGVSMENLLQHAGIRDTATGILVYAPDGWSNYHPLESVSDPELYHVNGTYPATNYFYDQQADQALNADGWCDYSAPSCTGRQHLDFIYNPNGLKMILAYKREGAQMDPGVLDASNKLDGEGPFRVVPPQKNPNAPDQSSSSTNQSVIWPYVEEWDHNAGSASRSATIIKVEPLPEGTTDINVLEAGWNYVDEGKIIIYGAIDVNAPVNPTPADNSSVPLDSVLSWTPVEPDTGYTVVYDVYFGTDAVPETKVSDDQTGSTYDPGVLTDQTKYYWKVVAQYSDDSEASSPVWNFTAREVGTIQGTVYTSITTSLTGSHMGIVGATVTINETGQTTVTDTQGNYLFTEIPSGIYTLIIEKENFNPAQVSDITVQGGIATNVTGTDMTTDALLVDVNGDGRLGLADAIHILRIISGY